MLTLYQENFSSRLLLGTAGYPSLDSTLRAIEASGCEIITVGLKRELYQSGENVFWRELNALNKKVLPNTAGCFYAKDAVTTALMAQEIFSTNWIKLEVIGDQYTLQPDPFELVIAAAELIRRGFKVLPYCSDDLILCKRLIEVGCEVLMPWAAPIGTGQGLINPQGLLQLRARFPHTLLIIDAGIGKPSDAALALELGFDAVLLNSAVSQAGDPIGMARAFKSAVESGRLAYESGLISKNKFAVPSTPMTDTPFWQQASYE